MITINWLTKVIYIPKDYMTLTQSSPVEIRELDLNLFRLELKNLEDDEEGIVYPKTHNHNTEVSIGGLTYARVIEIINDYTVTFEDGQYAVNLVGANSNVGDKVNVNQVSVRSQNSAGNTSSPIVEFSSFNNGVTIQEGSGNAGTVFPIGTPLKPVDNLTDALLICEYRGFKTLYVKGSISLASENLEGFIINGENAIKSHITLEDSLNIINGDIREATVSGILDGDTIIRNSIVNGLVMFNGVLFNSALTQAPISLGGVKTAMLLDCYSGVPGGNARPQIDFNGEPTSLAIRNWHGGLELVNKTTTDGEVSIDIGSGTVYVRDSCTAGEITIRGGGNVIDESGEGCIVKIDGLFDPSINNTKLDAIDSKIDIVDGKIDDMGIEAIIARKMLTNKVVAIEDVDGNYLLDVYDDDGVMIIAKMKVTSDGLNRLVM